MCVVRVQWQTPKKGNTTEDNVFLLEIGSRAPALNSPREFSGCLHHSLCTALSARLNPRVLLGNLEAESGVIK